jgi:hypothetical protein
MNQLVPFRSADVSPALIATAGESVKLRFVEFFTANIRNRNTRSKRLRRLWNEGPSRSIIYVHGCAGIVTALTPEREEEPGALAAHAGIRARAEEKSRMVKKLERRKNLQSKERRKLTGGA